MQLQLQLKFKVLTSICHSILVLMKEILVFNITLLQTSVCHVHLIPLNGLLFFAFSLD